MKILKIGYSWPCTERPGIGWPIYYHTKYANSNDEVFVITADREGLLPVEGNVKFIKIPYLTNDLGDVKNGFVTGLYLFGKKILGEIRFFLRARKYMREIKSDVTHIYSPIPMLCGMYCKYILNSKLLMSLHGTDVERICRSRFYQKLLYIPDAVVTVGQSMNDKLSSFRTRRKIMTIGNGVNTGVFKDLNLQRENQIIQVANLKWPKGQEILLEAFKYFHDDHPEYRLIIIGEGDKRPILEKYCEINGLQDVVKLVGYQTGNYINEQLNRSKCYVLSSEIEGFPKSVIEAMTVGTPVISTDVGNVREVVNDSGIIVAINAVDEMVNALEKMLFDGNWNERHEKSKVYAKKYTWEKVGEKLNNIYETLYEDKE